MTWTIAAQDLLGQVREWCQEHLRVESVEEAEQMALALSRQVAEVIVSEGVRQTAGEASYEGCSVACGCGRRARFKGYRPRWIVTLAGSARVERAYYYCRQCHSGQAPWDQRQGLSQRQWTAGVKALVAHFAGYLTYGETVELLELSTGLRVQEYSAEQIVQEVGQQLRAQAAREQAAVLAGEVVAGAGPAPGRLYIGLDGTQAHIDGSWHEVKMGVIYEGVPGEEGVDEARDCQYVAAQEPAESFGERTYAAAVRRGEPQAGERVVIGDGADWIWNLAAYHYPGATEIVDYWHACEHIWGLRQALYPLESRAGDRWAREHCQRLYAHGPADLLRALKRMRPCRAEQAEAIRVEEGYFRKHRQRMQYPQFRARGLMVGSGPVEAGCKVVVGQRLKRAGMRWCRGGADAVLAVRCALLNKQAGQLQQAARAAA